MLSCEAENDSEATTHHSCGSSPPPSLLVPLAPRTRDLWRERGVDWPAAKLFIVCYAPRRTTFASNLTTFLLDSLRH